jgi:Thrombospondin type 3 repeat
VRQAIADLSKTHSALLACDPPLGWSAADKIDPTPGLPNSGDEGYCSQVARGSLAIAWRRDLTAAEHAANPACPPTCKIDFDLTTTENEAIIEVGGRDRNAGLQLAIQSGEGRTAGAGDVISGTPLTLASVLGFLFTDARCRLGGWGNAPGFVGRCSDGSAACVPGDPANGDLLCSGQGGQCRACNGPIDPRNTNTGNGQPNALGLPPGYNTHSLPELDLVVGQRLGIIAGVPITARVPLFLVGTTGYAAADFRDVDSEGGAMLDVSDLGPVDPAGTPFAIGVGTGGTFQNGSALAIGETCCATGGPIVWAPAQVGQPLGDGYFLRTFDAGPGSDGIPGCTGDNELNVNGAEACNQRLGFGNVGPKTDGFFATGKDDVAEVFPVGASGVIPASAARFHAQWHGSGLFCAPEPPVPVFNVVAATAFRDASYAFVDARNLDGIAKLDVTLCPILSGQYDCKPPAVDSDCDGVPDSVDNCPLTPDPSQADNDADGVGDACDNCRLVANPRVAASYLTANPWATLTGGQRDDDHDGYGNRCDAKFVGSGLVGGTDLAQLRASLNKSRSLDVCGTSGVRPCAIFDLDEVGALNSGTDLAVFRSYVNKLPGPKCAACPLACAAGTAGTCGPVP